MQDLYIILNFNQTFKFFSHPSNQLPFVMDGCHGVDDTTAALQLTLSAIQVTFLSLLANQIRICFALFLVNFPFFLRVECVALHGVQWGREQTLGLTCELQQKISWAEF